MPEPSYAYEKAILDQHTLLAPFDALVIDRQKELGTVIKAGDPIFTLIAIGLHMGAGLYR